MANGNRNGIETQPSLDATDILTSHDVAKLLGISRRTVLAALKAGELEGKKIGGRRGWITTRAAVRRYVEGGNASE